ncbi:MAG: transcription antitermination factor NusB [Candidatus Zambryskibacteria bacterium RIFCSPHIGHO2_01_FULL_49_18]|uniref:Transcription antitermination protein NusB n=2 Tax=Candidatus Zambryskiibacteriota TaxID=1817925 RepID=A0A1G2T1S0_9BACT|nr:MAG: transcription antitermination factor NusB [Candidatus Zambryskibacteria bacterium RIFCSPHIGHO2_01_FULL_49_18]OHB06112.1 MAG: transcription antitermination factor NusB [Candidatus Zambryskibacteria bacterium RIFCSPLOWO2_01_FULL_47_14]
MSQRHLSRSIVLQTLFEWDFPSTGSGQVKPDVRALFEKNITEFAPGSNDQPFMERLLKLVLDKRQILDDLIEKAAPEWPIERIAPVDRNILRIGLAELLFADRKEVPPKVAINEAIELGKQFGGETSGRFINGVLGAVYKEMGEPGKDDKPKPKKKYGNVPLDQLPVEKLAGAVVFAKHEGNIYMACVHDVFGHWTLPKGKIGDNPKIANETTEEGLIREVQEELGIPVKVVEPLGENSYSTFHPEKGKIVKHVAYFLAEGPFTELTLEKKEEKGGLDDVRWFKLADILDLNFYDDILPIVTKAITKLAEQA